MLPSSNVFSSAVLNKWSTVTARHSFRAGRTHHSHASHTLRIRRYKIGNNSRILVSSHNSIIESDKLQRDVRIRTMEAINALEGRVTVGDVASWAGIKVYEAEKALQTLASDTHGFLEVSNEGDILYVFPKEYQSKLAMKSFKTQIEAFINSVKTVADHLVKVSFGATLVASTVLVFAAIAYLLSHKSEEDDNERASIRSYDLNFNFFSLPDLLTWELDLRDGPKLQRRSNDGYMNLVESVFSFVFGDGNSNRGFEEERWKLIGKYIASNGGVVAAEELAPYLDLQGRTLIDESYVLPVLLQFDGRPKIDEEGNILYEFPSLQRTASPSWRKKYLKRQGDHVNYQRFLEEKNLFFSKTTRTERAMVVGLGGLNLVGVVMLRVLLKNATIAQTGFIDFVRLVLPLLHVYAVSFFAIPLIRWIIIAKKNANIEKRNQERKHFAQVLALPHHSLMKKLVSARSMARATVVDSSRAVYSTKEGLLEQNFQTLEWDSNFQNLQNMKF